MGAGSASIWQIRKWYGTPKDWSAKTYVSVYLFGLNDGKNFEIRFSSDSGDDVWTNRYYKTVTDNWTGWKRVIIPKNDFSSSGSPNWNSIYGVAIRGNGSKSGTMYSDYMAISVGVLLDLSHVGGNILKGLPKRHTPQIASIMIPKRDVPVKQVLGLGARVQGVEGILAGTNARSNMSQLIAWRGEKLTFDDGTEHFDVLLIGSAFQDGVPGVVPDSANDWIPYSLQLEEDE